MNPISVQDVSIIVSVYKDTESLRVVLTSLDNQSVKGFEVIVSEDGESDEMKDFLSKETCSRLLHVTQKDEGWRKNRVLNKSIRKARGSYLIFLDGDCVPNVNFVQAHVALSRQGSYLLGRRVFLGAKFSDLFRREPERFIPFTKTYLRYTWSLHRDGVRHFEDGVSLPLHETLHRIVTAVRGVPNIVGCHFSCFKEDLVAINGFDEDYVGPGAGEDEDLVWRFERCNLTPRSCRNFANVFHLDHSKRTSAAMSENNLALMHRKMEGGSWRCVNGLLKDK